MKVRVIFLGICLSIFSHSAKSAGDPAAVIDGYDPNQVRNDDLRKTPKDDAKAKADRDKRLDEIVDKYEEIRIKEEELLGKKEIALKSNKKDEVDDIDDDLEDLADDRKKIDKELAKLKDI